MRLAENNIFNQFKNLFVKKEKHPFNNEGFWEEHNRYYNKIDYNKKTLARGFNKELTAKELMYILYFSPELEEKRPFLKTFDEIFKEAMESFYLTRVGFHSFNSAKAFYYILKKTKNGESFYVTLSMNDFIEEGNVKESHYFSAIEWIEELGIIRIEDRFDVNSFRKDISVGITFFSDYVDNMAFTV